MLARERTAKIGRMRSQLGWDGSAWETFADGMLCRLTRLQADFAIQFTE